MTAEWVYAGADAPRAWIDMLGASLGLFLAGKKLSPLALLAPLAPVLSALRPLAGREPAAALAWLTTLARARELGIDVGPEASRGGARGSSGGREGAPALLRPRELSAAGGDVDAAALAHGAWQREFIGEDFLELPRRFAARGSAGITGGRVQGNEIHLRGQALQEAADGSRVRGRVVFPLDERPLVKNAPARLPAVGAARFHKLGDGPFPGGGNQLGALGLRGGMQ